MSESQGVAGEKNESWWWSVPGADFISEHSSAISKVGLVFAFATAGGLGLTGFAVSQLDGLPFTIAGVTLIGSAVCGACAGANTFLVGMLAPAPRTPSGKIFGATYDEI